MDCLLIPFMVATLWQPCPSGLYTTLDRPNAFRETPFRPLSTAFEIDTRAILTDKEYFLSLDLWKFPQTGYYQRPASGIDLWSLMIGVNF
jgi:hypothetical protein